MYDPVFGYREFAQRIIIVSYEPKKDDKHDDKEDDRDEKDHKEDDKEKEDDRKEENERDEKKDKTEGNAYGHDKDWKEGEGTLPNGKVPPPFRDPDRD